MAASKVMKVTTRGKKRAARPYGAYDDGKEQAVRLGRRSAQISNRAVVGKFGVRPAKYYPAIRRFIQTLTARLRESWLLGITGTTNNRLIGAIHSPVP